MKPIKVIALDIGNVVLDIDIETHLQNLGIREPWSLLSQWPAHWDFETGKLDSAGFYQAVRERFSLSLTDNEIEFQWNKIIRGFLPGMSELLRQLSKKAKVVAITNTNPPHVSLFRQMKEFENFHYIFASHEVGHRKPGREIFEFVVQNLKVAPQEIAFFDDLKENVEAANQVGLQAFHCYRAPDLIRKTLLNLGLKI